ncbi:MAG: response regulator [Nitrospirae bacterium]|nr:response regulator [Nitrospirota bacterium]MBI5695670.1 response regulator [Nitrospirota bacterium]
MSETVASVRAKAKVLVVEDEGSVRDALMRILASYGHTVVGAEDGEAALAVYEAEVGFQIVMTDLSLPGKSGWDVARAIRKKDPDIPIVLLSGWDVDESGDEYRGSGVSRLLPKPVKIKEMLALVDELVHKVTEG